MRLFRPLMAIVVVLLLVFSIRMFAVVPIDSGVPSVVLPVTVNVGAGDQYDPHVVSNLASYTSDANVRYYDFFTSNDSQVPGTPNTKDELSDVSNGKIAFARLDLNTFNQSVMVFDTLTATTTEVDPQTSPHRSSAAIGSNTVAFIDSDLAGGEVVAAQLGGDATRVTNDTRFDQRPQVAPSGTVIVYESCASSPSNCDIRQAAWNGATWAVSSLTNNAEPEANPDTDGVVVVYDAQRAGDRDIYWQAVGGGAEQRLELAGEQRNPSVSGGLIAFESVAVGLTTGDLFVYQIATNRLFRITSTPFDESLNDVSVLSNGQVRLVWNSGPSPDRDVYGATIELPDVNTPFNFSSFLQPVDPYPTFNVMKAGGAVPVRFSLGGFQGLSIFASGYPKSQIINCSTSALQADIEQTVTAGNSTLSYDATTDQYTYVWKTDKSWAGTCRQLTIRFTDNTDHVANFRFK